MRDYPEIQPHFIQIKELNNYGLEILELESLEEKRYNIIKGNSLKLNFQYLGINLTESKEILKFYIELKGYLTPFKIANKIFNKDQKLLKIISYSNPQNIWRFSTPIESKTTVTGLYDLNFEIKGITE